ncbi:hypothetical protein CDAR_39321 [Caerostris darwini]|uniref:Uncharacterized protein n=1 Tax=Caerostris darwini TaxID=1538125 RepID=A0AAV4U668_9ARAC|nr:hypothetical protein CDAR_39321 [Caerostris darwini]
MDRKRTFEDLKKFVHMTTFLMGVKTVTDCFEVGIFDAGVMLIVGIVIHKMVVYNWTNLLVIWKRMMLISKKCLSTVKFILVIFDLKVFGDIRTKLINRFVTVKVKTLDCVCESHSLILDTLIDSWRCYVALKPIVAGLILFMLVETFLVAVCFYGSFETTSAIFSGQRTRAPGDTSLKKTHRDFYLLGDVETKSFIPYLQCIGYSAT